MSADSNPSSPPSLQNTKALLFDVFGTVVNWRSTVHQELIRRSQEKLQDPNLPKTFQSRLKTLNPDDWAQFAQEWRNSYGKFTTSFIQGVTVWKDIDTHHHESLIFLLEKWDLANLYTAEEVKSLSLIWHYLTPWPDSARGLEMLGTQLITCTLSNGNQSLLQDLNEHGGLGFQRLISSADFRAYKPNPKTYLGAVAALGLEPGQCAMVAAHLGDLEAARECGLKAIYVERPREEAWIKGAQSYEEARNWADLWIGEDEGGFIEVARRLGIQQQQKL